MYDAKATAEQEWEVFKALCPKELMNIIESPDITLTQFQKIINALTALGFHDSSEMFTKRRLEDVKRNWAPEHRGDVIVFWNTRMREERFGYEYVQLFIDNVKNLNMKKYFENCSERYATM